MEEDWVLFILRQAFNFRWSDMTNFLLGRSDNSIKNYWNSSLSLRSEEMDQVMHGQFQSHFGAGYPDGWQHTMQEVLHY